MTRRAVRVEVRLTGSCVALPGEARADDSRGEGQDASRAAAADFQPAAGRPGNAAPGSLRPTLSAGRVRVRQRVGEARHVHQDRVGERAGGRRPQGIPASRPASRGGVPVRGGGHAHDRRVEVPGPPEPQHNDALPQYDQPPASPRVVASRAGESGRRAEASSTPSKSLVS